MHGCPVQYSPRIDSRIDSRIYFSGKVFTAEFVFDTRIPCRIEFFIRIHYMNYFLCEKSILIKNMQKTCRKHAEDRQKICRKQAENMQKPCKNMQKTCRIGF